MDLVLIPILALAASLLTFFSGFGLGTVLMPALAVFFPLPLAIAATAVVHLLNNLMKLALVGRAADRRVLAPFALAALPASAAGALLLVAIDALPTLATYTLGGREHAVTLVKLTVGVAVLFIGALELRQAMSSPVAGTRPGPRDPAPAAAASSPSPWPLVVGGALSGFFGGLSGQQGALRSAVLIRQGLSKEAYIATGVVIACVVDVARLVVYAPTHARAFAADGSHRLWVVLALAVAAAAVGTILGSLLLRKVTLRAVQRLVAVLLLVVGVGLISGLI